jgi:hypothetical protein
MPAVLQRHPLVAVLAVVAAILAAVIGFELALGTTSARSSAGTKRPAPAEVKLLPAVVASAPEQAYPEMAARPLFTPTRRPAPEAPAAQASAMVKGQFTLQGVTIVGDTRIALLREKSSGRTHRVERGRDVNGMTLASVDADRVVLAQGADREELVLMVQKGPSPPVQPTVAVGPAGVLAPQQPAVPPRVNPIAAPPGQPITGAGPFLPPGFNPTPAPAATPTQPAAGAQTSAAPLTPEELLARRRARRTPGAAQ